MLGFLAMCLTHVQLRSWEIPQGKIAHVISTLHFCSSLFPQIMTSQVLAALVALCTNFQLPCQRDCYKLLAAALCSAFMFHKENWQMPWGVLGMDNRRRRKKSRLIGVAARWIPASESQVNPQKCPWDTKNQLKNLLGPKIKKPSVLN